VASVDVASCIGYGAGVLVARVVNALIAAVTLTSALAVLGSDLLVPGYREHYHDALWFVAAYVAVQAFVLLEFVRGGRWMPALAVAKTVAAYLFLLGFPVLWPRWRFWTPARYVYQLFAWDDRSPIGLFALVFLGRGAFNTMNAVYLTRPWWLALRARRPLLGRLATSVPIGVTALCIWAFFALVREEKLSFSPEAQEVARVVFAGLECETLRERAGQTSTDVRQSGERRYRVEITYGCALTRVVVRAEDGRIGTVTGARPECCRA
jgi:hypothetical protein